MRLDIAFYLLATTSFVFAALILPLMGVALLPVAFLIVLLLFGMLFAAFGYSTRPRHYRITTPPKPPMTIEEKPSQPPETKETPAPQLEPPSPQIQQPKPPKPTIELTKIKGIGPKRVAALTKFNIASAADLAKISPEELASKLGISSKITSKWVEQAQNLVEAES